MLKASLSTPAEFALLGALEAYIETIEADNIQLSLALKHEIEDRMHLDIVKSQYENLILISQLNKQFARKGRDAWKAPKITLE